MDISERERERERRVALERIGLVKNGTQDVNNGYIILEEYEVNPTSYYSYV